MLSLNLHGKSWLTDPELIIFDKDGTLIDIHFYWTKMIRLRANRIVDVLFPRETEKANICSQLMEVMGADEKTGRIKRSGPVGVKPRIYVEEVVVEAVHRLGGGRNLEAVQKIFKEVDSLTMSNIGSLIHLLPGVLNFLKEAKAVGIPLAVATSDATKKTEEAFRQEGILKYFVKIVGGDRTTSPKPAPQVVNILINELSVSKEKSVMIGDHPVDIETGINAGLKHQVGVLTGLGERNDFKSYPCEIINSLEEIVINHS